MTSSENSTEITATSVVTEVMNITTSYLTSTFDYTGNDSVTMEMDNTTEVYHYDEYNLDIYMYPGYSFERPIYLYIWEILVIITTLVNILVISVLMRKGMRNPTNTILAAIAISDSLTGLVTLPTYILAYSKFEPVPDYLYDTTPAQASQSVDTGYNNSTASYLADISTSMGVSGQGHGDTTRLYEDYANFYAQEGYALSKDLCTWFMLSKFFFSKMFHTISIFLTLFLGFQRFVSVAYPFKAQSMFRMRNTLVVCVVIFVLSPFLHIYHIVKEKTVDLMCEWRIENCNGDCFYLWFILFVRHIIPCILLSTFTALFVRELCKGRLETNKEQIKRRAEENRRVCIIVTAIVIVFLLPEIPYGVFLLSSVIKKHADIAFDLQANRAIHASYEILLVLSFHANFYIYTFLNKRFRAGLKRTVLFPLRRAVGKPARWTLSRSHSGRSTASRKTGDTDWNSKSATELRLVRLNTSENNKTTTLERGAQSKLLRDNSVSN